MDEKYDDLCANHEAGDIDLGKRILALPEFLAKGMLLSLVLELRAQMAERITTLVNSDVRVTSTDDLQVVFQLSKVEELYLNIIQKIRT
jgi:hypothetical protein